MVGLHNHSSTVGLIYANNTFPTPWPILTVSILYSFITSLWALISDYRILKKRFRNPSMPAMTVIRTVLMLGSQTIRIFSVCTSSIAALQNVDGGKFASPLSSLTLTLSMVPYLNSVWVHVPDTSYRTKVFWTAVQAVAAVNTIISIVITCITFVGFLRPADPYYSKSYLSGGNCPIVVSSCLDTSMVGCGLDNKTLAGKSYVNPQDPNIIHWANYIRAEGYIESILFWISSPLSLFAFGSLLFLAVVNMGLVIASPFSSTARVAFRQQAASSYPKYQQEGPANPTQTIDNVYNEALEGGLGQKASSPLLILIFAAIEIPLHYLQEAKPRSVYVIDSLGPLVEANSTLTSWSDCFKIHAPADHYGFLNTWAQNYANETAVYLGLI